MALCRFLDNSLRGGIPTILGNVDGGKTYDEDDGVKVFHSFSRIHGDLERYVVCCCWMTLP
jgi:hypothetical protein